MRPDGVVSKKLMGERNMAIAILSCNFLEAYSNDTGQLCARLIRRLQY